MRADELSVGMVVDYRGQPAAVVECWINGKCKDRGFGPVGCVLELESSGETLHVRLEWPAREDWRQETPEEYAARLLDELELIQLDLWPG